MTGRPWKDAPLVALDLEGSGAQDRDDEAILEIAVVALADGGPCLGEAYHTLINPGRAVPRRPWISPGLADLVLAAAPTLADVEPELARRLNGRVIVGHNVSVDWRLLHRRCPAIQPAGLLDTLRLARHAHPGKRGHSLTALLERYELTGEVTRLCPASRPHRALWDTVAVTLLLAALIDTLHDGKVTIDELQQTAGIPIVNDQINPPPLLNP